MLIVEMTKVLNGEALMNYRETFIWENVQEKFIRQFLAFEYEESNKFLYQFKRPN